MDNTSAVETFAPSESSNFLGKIPAVDPKSSTSTSISHGKNDDHNPKTEEASPRENQDAPVYVEGLKLAIVVASVALSCFLMLLDTMVISTVSHRHVLSDQLRSC